MTEFTTISLPDGEYGGVAWFDEFLIIESLSTNGERHAYSSSLWKMNLAKTELELLSFPNYAGCGTDGLNGFENPEQLPDNRLGFSIVCRQEQDINETHLVFMAYNIETEHLEQLPKYEMPHFFIAVEISWNPQMTQGIAFADNRLNSWVFGFSMEDWEPLDLGFPQVRGIDWSPDGSKIAFIAAPEQGISGLSLMYSDFNLYLMNPDGSDMNVILKNINNPYSILWSRDGKHLIFNGTIGQVEGVWLLNIFSKDIKLIFDDYLGLGGWSSDGNRLLGIHRVSDTEQEEIVILDLSDIVN